ncbi:MAG: FAD:protein FMN transferase [Armatimonadota bacterium]
MVEQPWRLRVTREAMHAPFEIILHGDRDERALQDIAESAVEEVKRLEGQLSAFIPSSDLCWINDTAWQRPVPVEPGLFDLLSMAADVHAETEGAFDITVGPLLKCWGFFRRQGALPGDEELASAREKVGMRHVALDADRRTVRFLRQGVELNLGALGKGYAVDRAVEHLRQWQVTCALVHSGASSIYALGCPPGLRGWRVGILDPRDRSRRVGALTLRDQALCTSGNWEQYFTVDGTRYGHLIDPRSGWPAQGMLGTTVLGASAAEADALATAFFVLGVEGTRQYCDRNQQAAVLFSEVDGERMAVHEFGCTMERECLDYEDRPRAGTEPPAVLALGGSPGGHRGGGAVRIEPAGGSAG